MDMDLKRQLRAKLDIIAPEYGMIELSYPSFVRCYGYHLQPLSAADAVEALNALLDAATGVQMEVEVEGARNGGEWFGGGRTWRAGGRWSRDIALEGDDSTVGERQQDGGAAGAEEAEREHESWTVRNFWNAFDALDEYVRKSSPVLGHDAQCVLATVAALYVCVMHWRWQSRSNVQSFARGHL